MAKLLQRVVARYGLAAQIAQARLIIAEIGWDADTKVFRVGDDTEDPPMIATSKSTAPVIYSENTEFTFPTIHMHPGATVDGVTVSLLNASPGILVRGSDSDSWHHRKIVPGDQYIKVTNQDGTEPDDIKIGISEELVELIRSLGGVGGYSYGDSFPTNVKPGHFFLNTDEGIVYIRAAASEDPSEHWWMDITTVGSERRNGGSTYYARAYPPETAAPGDFWHDIEEDILYFRFADENGFHWRSIF